MKDVHIYGVNKRCGETRTVVTLPSTTQIFNGTQLFYNSLWFIL